ncbi:MAG: peptidylprolyl isomerase [Bifidobacteriaceae bacterium]|jgi:peptidyl-prolyl cis-trans isomerase B (cyclophilin B)|nr:peptidylprolyl isomerase [Bifidobacteriaceae bacterium]
MSEKSRKQQRNSRKELLLEKQRQKNKRNLVNLLIIGLSTVAVIGGLIVAYHFTSPSTYQGQSPSPEATTPTPSESAASAPVSESEQTGQNQGSVPDKAIAENKDWDAVLHTSLGDLSITLLGSKAPQAVANFIDLSRNDWWSKNDAQCPRVTTENVYILQCGAPKGDQSGGPGYSFGPVENAPSDNIYKKGYIAMARSDSAFSNGSQFFIIYQDSNFPPGGGNAGYAVFAEIKGGLDNIENFAKEQKPANGDGKPSEVVKITGADIK